MDSVIRFPYQLSSLLSTLSCILITFLRLLHLTNWWFPENKKRYHCYWHHFFYATKFACSTNLVSLETRQVCYKFLHQKRPSFFHRCKTYRTEVSHFSLYHHYTPDKAIQCHTPSWSHDHISSNAKAVFFSGASLKGDCLNFFLGGTLTLVSDWVFRWVVSLRDAGLISSSLSDDSHSLSLTNGVLSRAAGRSFTWRRVPLTDTDCSQRTLETRPFFKLEVHRLLGGFTQTGSPILYGLCISLQLGRHTLSIP